MDGQRVNGSHVPFEALIPLSIIKAMGAKANIVVIGPDRKEISRLKSHFRAVVHSLGLHESVRVESGQEVVQANQNIHSQAAKAQGGFYQNLVTILQAVGGNGSSDLLIVPAAYSPAIIQHIQREKSRVFGGGLSPLVGVLGEGLTPLSGSPGKHNAFALQEGVSHRLALGDKRSVEGCLTSHRGFGVCGRREEALEALVGQYGRIARIANQVFAPEAAAATSADARAQIALAQRLAGGTTGASLATPVAPAA